MMVGLRAKLVNALIATKRTCGIRGLVWALSLTVTSVSLCFVPLYNLLGYDFAFVIGLIAAFAAVDLGQGEVARARLDARSAERRGVWGLVMRATAASGALLVLPLVVISANALRVRNCNFVAGIEFYALLPVGTVLFAAPAGVLAGLLSVGRGRLLAFCLPVVCILWTAARMYVSPPVYAFDPFGGYFPGPIYDEALTAPTRLLFFRLANALWAAALVIVADALTSVRGPNAPQVAWRSLVRRRWFRKTSAPQSAAFVLFVAAAAGVFLEGGQLGFHRSHGDLRRHLPRTNITAHFRVHSSFADGQSSSDMELFLRELEFRYDQLTQILQTEPKTPITVFLFPNADVKKDLVGAGATLFTKPWRQEIFVQVDAFPQEHLRHELAHIFAGSFGDPIFGISLRWLPWPKLASGLVEGIAEASDFSDPQGGATLHQDARTLLESKQAAPLDQLMGASFSTVAGPQAYTLSASFCHFLLQRFGPQRFAALYRSGGDFQAAYAVSLQELESGWHAFLLTQPLDEDQKSTAAERYRRPAIFKKVCARELAARVAEAARVRAHDPTKAVTLLQSVCADDPGEPVYQLSLAYAQAAAKQTDAARSILHELENRPELTRPMRRRVASFRTSLAVMQKQNAAAVAAETTAFQLSGEESDRRAAVARLRALQDPRAFATLGRVLFGDLPTDPLDGGLAVHLLNQFAHEFPNEALGPYLLGRQLVSRDPALAFTTLQQACPDVGDKAVLSLPTPLSPLFKRECLRLLGESAFRAGAYANAKAAWQASAANATNAADRLRATDFLERVAWAQNHLTRP